jgi:hypothetical protein
MEAFRVGLGRFRKDDGEAALAEVAGDVGRADRGPDPFAGGDQIRSSTLREVEEEKAEPAVVAPRASDLAAQALFEIPRAVEARDVIRVPESARLGKEPRVLERRSEYSGQLLELLELRVGEHALHAPPEDREGPDRLLAVGEERHGQPPAQTELVVGRLVRRVEVGQADGPRAASLGRQADELTAGFVLGEAERRDNRVAFLLAEDDHGAVGARDLAHGVEGPP